MVVLARGAGQQTRGQDGSADSDQACAPPNWVGQSASAAVRPARHARQSTTLFKLRTHHKGSYRCCASGAAQPFSPTDSVDPSCCPLLVLLLLQHELSPYSPPQSTPAVHQHRSRGVEGLGCVFVCFCFFGGGGSPPCGCCLVRRYEWQVQEGRTTPECRIPDG